MLEPQDINSLITTDKKREFLLSKIKQLDPDELVSCEAFWMGNDPIGRDTVAAYHPEKSFLLVGTSMFGAISLACHLTSSAQLMPDVIIVDISKQVFRCWGMTKEYFKNNEEIDAIKFVDGFIAYLEHHDFHGLSMDVYDSKSNRVFREFLLRLINDYGFEYIKKMVDKTVIIKQSWGDFNTFNIIREVYDDVDIYAYPSNIIHSISDTEGQIGVALCIEALKPRLSVQTNLLHGEPTKVYLITDNTASNIMDILGFGPFTTQKDTTIKTKMPLKTYGMMAVKERSVQIKSEEERVGHIYTDDAEEHQTIWQFV